MLIHSAAQLLTLAGGPQRGRALGTLGIIEDGAVWIREGRIAGVGTTAKLSQAHGDEPSLNASGCVVMPGFVDAHTHAIWSGDRAMEFEMRLKGAKYLEILAAGGGILSTLKATRAASLQSLVDQTRPRLQRMFSHGTTTAEVKTGYGLEAETELRMLEALLVLDSELPIDLVATYLGAHAIAPEFSENPQGYTDLLCDSMLPGALAWWQSHAPGRPLPYVDAFCEKGAFTLAQTRQILSKAKALGFPLKVHTDEFENLGGAALAAELQATSADHLVKASDADIAALGNSDTAAVALPCTPFGLGEHQYTPARKIIEAGGLLALATDCNPGTAWNESMQFAIALACRFMGLTPAEAIAASTINGAQAVGRAHEVGSLEEGKQADLLLLDVADYRHVGYRFGANLVRQIVKRGRLHTVNTGYHQGS